ncbi:hypothetical protein O3G_MSEX001873 [Manduca sexta]|uniref:Esterase n=2 Tax=Manduca sexta TaxID=7130 RepID=A0A922CCX7_MANSE|nr:hypothetical protein O3G_MSEX001873 [Manduca sexta]UXP71877.1 esterase [Manduca sexta]
MQSTLIILLACTAYLANAGPAPLQESIGQYSRYIQVYDEDGNAHQVDLEAVPDHSLLSEVARNPANNQYNLFTRRNPTEAQTLVMNKPETITESNFNPELPTKVIVHGWLRNQNLNINPTIRNAFLEKSDVNVIVMEWRLLALSDYSTAALGVPAVGRALGQFLIFLNDVTEAPFDSMHLIGFSLGAHLVGNAGREIEGKIARITALDPAGPLWNVNPARLSTDDAVYVEAIHTDGGIDGLGIGFAIADVDFFPNGGMSQPGCLLNICNHNRAWELFAATITYNHLIGTRCNNVLQIQLNTCRGPRLHMGNDNLKKTGSGMYRLDTRWRYPF